MAANQKLFLGFDFSTQQVKVLAVDEALSIVFEDAVKFDTDLPEFKTQGGAHIAKDNVTVTAPTIMWVKALDVLLDRMKGTSFNFSQVAAVSGAGQQHGSVYWSRDGLHNLQNADPKMPLHEALKDGFTVPDSPIWMDSSTTAQCRRLEDALGGPQKVADITGSRAYERFTGNQIAKVFQNNREAYDKTKSISLVSSFACSLMLGDLAPIDDSDGSGTNLLNIRTRAWDQTCLQACGDNLSDKLGNVVPSCHVTGNISTYLVGRYNFNPECKVVTFTGDNPASVAGMRLQTGEVSVSLGTSDTLFLWLLDPHPATQGHILANPVDTSAYMALLCYKNGSLTRERIRDKCAGGSWDTFNDLLEKTPRGNNGNIGFYFDSQEIIPLNIVGEHRFDGNNKKVSSFSPETEVRALIEGQFMAKRVHAEMLGYTIDSNTKVLATGGASSNKAILQVLSDVFNAPVFINEDAANSASLGSAYRAMHSYLGGRGVKFADVVKNAAPFTCAAQPNKDAQQIYTALSARFKNLEDLIVKETS